MTEINQQIFISTPPEKVWSVLADFGGADKWVPTILRSTFLEKNEGLGARRVFTMPSGEAVEEVVVDWQEGYSFTFEIPAGLGPVQVLREKWSVQPAPAGAVVNVTMRYQMRFGLAGALLDPLVVRPRLGRILNLNLEGLKRYLETGQGVDRG